jgi:hypothetical protein
MTALLRRAAVRAIGSRDLSLSQPINVGDGRSGMELLRRLACSQSPAFRR